jgi:hypothetical protein
VQFNFTFDPSVNSAPAGFKTVINSVAQFLENTFTDPVTVNVQIGFGEVAGQSLSSGALGESITYLNEYTYAQVHNAVAVDQTSADDKAGVNQLPSSDPANASAYWASTAEAKALGLAGASTNIDGSVGFSSSAPFDYDRSNGVAVGQYDFYGVVAHELTEIMGRTALLGGTIGGVSHSSEPMDLFRYTGAGTRDFVSSHAAYLSPDGGTTHLVDVNTNPAGDFGDWAPSAGNDAFLAFSNSGVMNQVTNADVRVMDLIGWNLGTSSPAPTHLYDNNWTIAGVGDLNGDHYSDLVWVQNTSGLLNIELMNGLASLSSADVTTSPFDNSWHIKATGDFNGDGKSDLVWTHNSDSIVEIQLFSGTTPIGGGLIANNPFSLGWNLVAAADFNGDGKSDLLWQRQSDGATEVQFLNGNSAIGGGVIANNPFDTSWKVVATGDFNGDGKGDLVWQHPADGLVEIQLLNGNSAIGGGLIANNPFGAGWSVVGAGDFNGNGKSSLVWQRQSDHLVEIQFLDGNHAIGGGVIANSPFGLDWNIAGIGDFNADGHADLVYRRVSDGLTEIQYLNGNAAIGGGVVGSNAAPNTVVPLASAADHDVYLAKSAVADPFQVALMGIADHPGGLLIA